MPLPIGVSVGDFILGLQLLKHSIQSLNDSRGSVAKYNKLIDELNNIEAAFVAVNNLENKHRLREEDTKAINDAVTSCRSIIEQFLKRVAAYQKDLKPGWHWKSSLRKVQWAVCKQKDVNTLRQELSARVEPLLALLMVLQLDKVCDQSQSLHAIGQNSEVAKGKIEQNENVLNKIRETTQEIARMHEESSTLQKSRQEELGNGQQAILDRLATVASEVLAVKSMIKVDTHVPSGPEFCPPIVLIDPTGAAVPFHVETVSTLNTFMMLIMYRFRDKGLWFNRDITEDIPWELDRDGEGLVYRHLAVTILKNCSKTYMRPLGAEIHNSKFKKFMSSGRRCEMYVQFTGFSIMAFIRRRCLSKISLAFSFGQPTPGCACGCKALIVLIYHVIPQEYLQGDSLRDMNTILVKAPRLPEHGQHPGYGMARDAGFRRVEVKELEKVRFTLLTNAPERDYSQEPTQLMDKRTGRRLTVGELALDRAVGMFKFEVGVRDSSPGRKDNPAIRMLKSQAKCATMTDQG